MTLVIKQALQSEPNSRAQIGGWIKTARQAGSSTKAWLFLEVNDGSDLDNLQVILSEEVVKACGFAFKDFSHTGTCVQLCGKIVKAPVKAKQNIEMQCDEILYVAASDADYPFAPKGETAQLGISTRSFAFTLEDFDIVRCNASPTPADYRDARLLQHERILPCHDTDLDNEGCRDGWRNLRRHVQKQKPEC